jgi:hypothetical protein
MPSTAFEPAIPATKRPQTYALDRAATVIGELQIQACIFLWQVSAEIEIVIVIDYKFVGYLLCRI